MFKVHTSYGTDEHNEPASTVLLMKVGGLTWRGSAGIHGVHLDANARMDIHPTDGHRQVIPQVTYTAPDGKVTVFNSASAKATAADLARGEKRTMDCVDCHNRATHDFQLPDRAVDEAIAQGQSEPDCPTLRSKRWRHCARTIRIAIPPCVKSRHLSTGFTGPTIRGG